MLCPKEQLAEVLCSVDGLLVLFHHQMRPEVALIGGAHHEGVCDPEEQENGE